MNLDDVRTIVQAVDDRTPRQPLLLPGSVGQVGADGLLEVVMDSDPEGSSIEARSLFADVAEGDRVMVLFDPPRGVYAVGLVARTVEAGQMIAYHEDEELAAAYGTGTTNIVTYSTPSLAWRAGRWYELRLSVTIRLDTVDTDPVEVRALLDVDFAPIVNRSFPQFSSEWGTVNGALVGGAVGTLHLSRLMLLSSDFAGDVELGLSLFTPGAGGDVDLLWELSVFDAGPSSAVTT